MKMMVFDMEITGEENGFYYHRITFKNRNTLILFSPQTKELLFPESDTITKILTENEKQFRKILNNKKLNTFYKGFKLRFSLTDKKNVDEFSDKTKIIVLDKRPGRDESYVIEKGLEGIHEIYTDGCFLEQVERGGYAVLIKNPESEYDLHTFSSTSKSNCLIELLAAIKGLEILSETDKIRIITDSQYVRKGLTEWTPNWKLNNWLTANGEKAKNIEYWKKFDELSQGKYLEFFWVKSHSDHFENSICDLYAREMALLNKEKK